MSTRVPPKTHNLDDARSESWALLENASRHNAMLITDNISLIALEKWEKLDKRCTKTVLKIISKSTKPICHIE